MEECYRQASSPELSPQKRLALLEQGLDEYQGDFLPRLAFNQWAAEQCHYYQTIEEKSVLLSAELLQTVGREKSIIGLAQWAVRSQPLSGTFQAMLIRTHLAAGNYTRALEQYNTAADLFYRQKGTGEGVLERLRTSFFEEHPEIDLRMETDLSMVEPTV